MEHNEQQNNGAQQSLDSSMGVDESLLSHSGKKKKEKNKQKSNFSEDPDSYSNYRQTMLSARRKKILAAKEKLKARVSVSGAINKETSALLRQAWINIIDSFGLTLIWINIHVILSYIFGTKAFCRLGEEWVGGGANPIMGKRIKKAKISERMLLILLDLIVLLLSISLIATLIIMYEVATGKIIIDILKIYVTKLIDYFKKL